MTGALPSRVVLQFDVNLQDQYMQIAVRGDKRNWERASQWVDAIGKLKGVNETCDSHMVWARCDVESRTYEGAKQEIEALLAKIDRLHVRYMRWPIRSRP